MAVLSSWRPSYLLLHVVQDVLEVQVVVVVLDALLDAALEQGGRLVGHRQSRLDLT